VSALSIHRDRVILDSLFVLRDVEALLAAYGVTDPITVDRVAHAVNRAAPTTAATVEHGRAAIRSLAFAALARVDVMAWQATGYGPAVGVGFIL
jgi:hypothetical protein